MTKRELAGRLCQLVTKRRLERIGEPDALQPGVDPLDGAPDTEIRNWLDMADAVLELQGDNHPIERLTELGRDWCRYTMQIADAAWRDEMRRAVIVEMRAEVDKLAWECSSDAGERS
jgi:hypothetical protein